MLILNLIVQFHRFLMNTFIHWFHWLFFLFIFNLIIIQLFYFLILTIDIIFYFFFNLDFNHFIFFLHWLFLFLFIFQRSIFSWFFRKILELFLKIRIEQLWVFLFKIKVYFYLTQIIYLLCNKKLRHFFYFLIENLFVIIPFLIYFFNIFQNLFSYFVCLLFKKIISLSINFTIKFFQN